MSRYKTAVIGAGTIAPRHIKAWQGHAATELVAIADLREDTARNRAAEFDIRRVYKDGRELLAKEKPDIVSVCTWMKSHAELCVAAIEAGARAVMCEKPLASSLAEVDRVIAAAKNTGARVAVGHQHRFSPVNTEARRLIAEGAIGEPTVLHRATGGGLTNNGCHAVDTARYLLGDPVPRWGIGQVARFTDRYERHSPIEDYVAGVVAFEAGARLVLETDLPEPKSPGEGSAVHGTDGTIVLGRQGLRLISAASGGWKDIAVAAVDVGSAQANELIDWLEGRVETHRNAVENGRGTIEILMGLYESARVRSLITFPLAAGPSPLQRMIDDGALRVTVPGKYDIRIDPPAAATGADPAKA